MKFRVVVPKVVQASLASVLVVFFTFGSFILPNTASAASNMATAAIDGAQTYQTIDGFGFSEAFGRANSMFNVSSTSPALQKQMLDLLFSPSTGAGLTILRNIISSDPTNTIEPNSPGSPSATPQYVWNSYDTGQVWLSQQAQSYGVHQIYADAWSAPGFMKDSGTEANGGTLCGVPGTACSTGDWRQAYANYLVQYIRDYLSSGVRLAEVGFLNEPNLAVSYSSMVVNPAQAVDFIKVLGPTLRAARLSTQIACCDAEGWDLAPGYADAIMSDPLARAYVHTITSHGYTGAPAFPLNAGPKHVWQTEWANFATFDPAWDDGTDAAGFTWAQRIFTGLTAGNLSGFLHWWGVNTSNTNSGLIHLDLTTNTLAVAKRFWAFANYSRFIRPGAVRIGAVNSDSNLDTVAFRNRDGSTTIVVLNTATTDLASSFTLQHVHGRFVIPYLTNGSNDTARQSPILVHGRTFSGVIPARSLITYQIPA